MKAAEETTACFSALHADLNIFCILTVSMKHLYISIEALTYQPFKYGFWVAAHLPSMLPHAKARMERCDDKKPVDFFPLLAVYAHEKARYLMIGQ